jgi:hypothetical protein
MKRHSHLTLRLVQNPHVTRRETHQARNGAHAQEFLGLCKTTPFQGGSQELCLKAIKNTPVKMRTNAFFRLIMAKFDRFWDVFSNNCQFLA